MLTAPIDAIRKETALGTLADHIPYILGLSQN